MLNNAISMNSIDKLTILLILTFFLLMITMELLVESLFRSYTITNPVVVSTCVTFSQFLGCFLIPFIRNGFVCNLPNSYKSFLGYILLSGLVYCATGLATLSVAYVSYPTKIIFKSTKLVPTMIISSIITKKTYKSKDYIAALLLCASAICYSYSNNQSNNLDKRSSNVELFGVCLLILSVLCDAVVPNIQQAMMTTTTESSKSVNGSVVSPEDMMINTNLIGLLVVGSYITYNNYVITLIQQSPDRPIQFILHLLSTGLCLGILLQYTTLALSVYVIGIAVSCYTHIIKRSGSVVAVTIATLRKIVTILLSYIVFPKPLSILHLIGALCVVIGMVIESYRF